MKSSPSGGIPTIINIPLQKTVAKGTTSSSRLVNSPRGGSRLSKEEEEQQLQQQQREQELEKRRFQRDVRRAFQVCSAQLLGLAFLVLCYYVYQMIEGMLGPLFWGLTFSIILKSPKRFLMSKLHKFKDVEESDSGFFSKIIQKFSLTLHIFYHSNLSLYLIGFFFIGQFACLFLGWFCWVPWFWVFTAALILVFLVAIILSLWSYESYESWVSWGLVFAFLFGIFLFFLFFVVQSVVEVSNFAFKMQELLDRSMKDPYWHQLLIEYDITTDSIQKHLLVGREYADGWLVEQGYSNTTELQELVLTYQNYTDLEVVKEKLSEWSFDDAKELILSWDILGWIQTSVESTSSVMVSLASGVGSVASSLYDTLNSVLDSLVFIGALLYFLESEDSLLDKFFNILPIPSAFQKKISHSISENINQIFISTFLLCLAHGAFAWVYFTIMGVDFAYSAAFLIGAVAIFPFLSPWLIYGPALLSVYLSGSTTMVWVYAIFIYYSDWYIAGYVDDKIFDLIPDGHPYFTAIVIVAGVSSFGVPGVLIGPMILVMVKTLYTLFASNVSDVNPEKEDEAD